MRGRSAGFSFRLAVRGLRDAAYDLVEALCGPETCWAGTDDEDVDRAAQCQFEGSQAGWRGR
jgi:hypothetical protein